MNEKKRKRLTESEIYLRYIKPQYTILKRIKRKIFGTEKKIKTIDDVIMLDYDLFIKLICLLMIYVLIRMVVIGIIDIYLWFFPLNEGITKDPFFIQILHTKMRA